MKRLELPLNHEELGNLKIGDEVLLSGKIYSFRDAAHEKIYQLIMDGKPLPIDLLDCCIYYMGSTPKKENEVIGSCGPTTSTRMDKYMAVFLKNGLQCTIGKGTRSQPVINLHKEHKKIYFIALGGCGALIKNAVTNCKLLAYPELLTEAVFELTIKDLYVIVGIDSFGNNIYDKN